MSELSKNFETGAAETKWNEHWKNKGYFNSKPDGRKAYTVVIPPPNVTGVLHMGHTLNETVQDILVRKARMDGYNACWVPGSDHASIATESKVVQMLKEKGIDKNDLSREEFLTYAFEWKEKYGGIIYNQIERLGCSVDWDRVTFTMDDHYYKAVIKVFVDMYNKGMIYRGARMINWDPAAKTALSDEEVEHKDIQGKLYHVRYKIADSDETIVIATQRPETIMGDTAICVNPDDERYAHLKGKKVIVPLINRQIPVIFDDYVDKTFGTGVLKVTPAHDINDYNLGLKHNLEVIDTLNPDGTLSEAAQIFVGVDRFDAREKIVAELAAQNQLVKTEEYATRVGYSQRSGAVVEPRISTQWFVKMKELAQPALKAVTEGHIKIHPGDKFLATYKYWLENVKDWCISRQLWWGQQIPAWYDEAGNMVVAENAADALQQMQATFGTVPSDKIRQDEDVLDTWFSSWLWPIEVFHGISNPGNEELKYYYPTSVLVTGQDIIFFWVARMVMAGMQYENTIPFKDVYFTGMVRDKLGRKMSKQLNNSPDLLDLIDRFGADAVRFGIMIASPAGNDLLFDEAALEQGSKFNNKMWNALKLLKMWEGRQYSISSLDEMVTGSEMPISAAAVLPTVEFAVEWFRNRLEAAKAEINSLIAQFRLSEALKTIYSLIWDDFCSWYLEWIKPGFEQPIDTDVYTKTIGYFTELMEILHPYMPFITEEIYHLLTERTDDLCVRLVTKPAVANQVFIDNGERLKKVITALREARAKNNIKPKETIELYIQTIEKDRYIAFENILAKQVNASTINVVDSFATAGISLSVEQDKFLMVSSQPIDTTAQKESLLKDLEHQQKFLESVAKMLSNEKFVANAKPEKIALERKKQSDAEARIKAITESLESLG